MLRVDSVVSHTVENTQTVKTDMNKESANTHWVSVRMQTQLKADWMKHWQKLWIKDGSESFKGRERGLVNAGIQTLYKS